MARRRWMWDRCLECGRRMLAYYRWIPICPRCFEAGCRLEEERAAPGEYRSQRALHMRAARSIGHPIRSVA